MAKLTFPTSPSVDDVYTQDGTSYQWDGSKWTANNDGAITLDAVLGNGSTTTKTMSTGAVTSPTAAKAWVNFNGGATVITIRDSYNVSSITDNGVGDYTINFTNALTNSNYCVSGTATDTSSLQGYRWLVVGAEFSNDFNKTNSSVRVQTVYDYDSTTDCEHVTVVIHGN